MKRSIFCLALIALLSGCSSAPRTVLRLETEPEVLNGGVELASEGVPAHALLERPHPYAVWVQGEYMFLDGHYVWVPGHWRDSAIAR